MRQTVETTLDQSLGFTGTRPGPDEDIASGLDRLILSVGEGGVGQVGGSHANEHLG